MDSDTRRYSFLNWFFNRPRTSGLLVFALVFSMSLYIVYQRHKLNEDNYAREMHNLLEVAYNNVDQALKNAANSALTLALTINDNGVPEHFETVGKQLIDSNKGIDAVQLVPGGKIQYVYPLEGNEPVLGYDIMNDPGHRPDLLKTIELGKMYFSGPFELRQGGMGIVGRLPVYVNNRFWGFSAVVIRLETMLLDTGMNAIDDSRYTFQLTANNPVTKKAVFLLSGDEDFSDRYSLSHSIPETDWNLHIITKETNLERLYPLTPLFIFGLVFSSLFGYVITLLLRKPQQLRAQVRRQAEKIFENEAKFKTMFQQAAIGIANIDSNTGKFLEINDAYAVMLGYSKAEMLRKDFMEVSNADDLKLDLELMEDLRQGRIREFSMEKRLVAKSGDTLWANLTVSPLWAEGEQPTTHIAIVEDITLSKTTQDDIRRSEARFKSLFENSPVALWEEDFSEVKKCVQELDLNLSHDEAIAYFTARPELVKKCMGLVRIIDVNNECLVMHFPKTKEELLTGLDSLLDDYTSEVFVLQLAAIVTGVKKFSADSKVQMESGEMRDVALGWSVMRGHESLLDRVIISAEDITPQKNSERAVLSSRRRLENLINTIEGIVWECDADTLDQHFISKKTEEILGYTVEDWLTDEFFWRKHLHPDDLKSAVDSFIKIAESKRDGVFEYRMMAKDGSVVWIRDIVAVVVENGKNIARGIMIDITANKAAEETLNESLELVNEHKKRLMNFSYIVSHNLRSHAANIQSITQFLDMGDTSEEQREMIDMLKTVSASLNDTMINLNDLVNIQTNDGLTIETLNLREYVNGTLDLLSAQIISQKATISVDVDDTVEVEYNAAYLESILHNLVSNALRYSSDARQPEISIKWTDTGLEKILEVSDNGIGIDLERHGDKLFGMYKTFNGNPDARGIGLFMTKSQVESMGGKISVRSELGKGTSFSISFK